MSELKRYHLYAGLECEMFSTARAVLKFSEEKDGIWVKYADYKKLEEENARLRSLDSLKAVSLTDSTNWQAIGDYAETKEENARLKAEVERLTERNKFLEQIDSYLQGANENAYEKRCDELEAEVERLNEDNRQLKKAFEIAEGIIKRMGNAAENAAKEGNPSV